MLVIDEREARTNPQAKRSLLALLTGDVEVDTLVSGDFVSVDTPLTLGIEHKSFNDLVNSLSSNRLDAQLTKLLDTYDVPVLLIDEMPAPSPNGKLTVYGAKHQVHFAWVMGSIAGWALRGVIPLMVRTPAAVGPTVVAMYKLVSKEEHRETYEPQRHLANLRPMTLTERVLVQFPGIGPERAATMASYSVEGLNDLDRDEWKRLLGPLTGGRTYDAWHFDGGER